MIVFKIVGVRLIFYSVRSSSSCFIKSYLFFLLKYKFVILGVVEILVKVFVDFRYEIVCLLFMLCLRKIKSFFVFTATRFSGFSA